jgi:hypothetical protein
MTQIRIWNYGDTFTSTRASTAQFALHEAGVYRGYDLTVTDVDVITLTTGYVLLPSGILVGEDVATTLRFTVLPAAATTYSITVRHVDADVIGGQAATYAIETGELTSIPDGIVLGWVRHPGGAVPLASSFVFSARKVLSEAADFPQLQPEVHLAPFTSKWATSAVGANTTVSNGFTAPMAVYTRVLTSALGPVPPAYETTTAVIPLSATRFRPFSLVVRAQVDTNCQLLVGLLDTDGNSVTLTGGTINPSVSFVDSTVSVDYSSGVFTEGDLYALTLEFRTPASAGINLQSVTLNFDPLP